MDRLYLRGRENVHKKLLIQAAACNLALLLRSLHGAGKPSAAHDLKSAAILALLRLTIALFGAGFVDLARTAISRPNSDHRRFYRWVERASFNSLQARRSLIAYCTLTWLAAFRWLAGSTNFESTCFNAKLSSVRSATTCFSFRFPLPVP